MKRYTRLRKRSKKVYIGWTQKEFDYRWSQPHNRLFKYLIGKWGNTVSNIETPDNPIKIKITLEKYEKIHKTTKEK